MPQGFKRSKFQGAPRRRVKKRSKLVRKVGKIERRLQKPGTTFKMTKQMSNKGIVMPERYMSKSRQITCLTINNPAIVGVDHTGFLLYPANDNVTGVNASNNVGATHYNFFNYEDNNAGGLYHGNISQVGAGVIPASTHGHGTLSNIYSSYTPYASSLKISVISSNPADNILLGATIVPLWWTGNSTYNTDDFLNTSNNRMFEGNYTKSKYFHLYRDVKPLRLGIKHNQLSGISKEEYLENQAYSYAYNSGQPSIAVSNAGAVADFIFPAYQIVIFNASNVDFVGNLTLHYEMTIWTMYHNQNQASIIN